MKNKNNKNHSQTKSPSDQKRWNYTLQVLNIMHIMAVICAAIIAIMLIPSVVFVLSFPMMSVLASMSGGNGESMYFWKVLKPTPMQQLALADFLYPVSLVLIHMALIFTITSLFLLVCYLVDKHHNKSTNQQMHNGPNDSNHTKSQYLVSEYKMIDKKDHEKNKEKKSAQEIDSTRIEQRPQ